MHISNLILSQCSLLENKPLFSDVTLDSSVLLTNNYQVFRNEVGNIYNSFKPIKGDMFFENLTNKTEEWTKLYIKWHSDIDPIAKKLCPRSCEIINSLKDVKVAMFSVLRPGARILPHSGVYKGCLRYHLGLITPNSDDCYMIVNGNKYSWRDGQGILIDDTFEHWVVNNTNSTRVILFCDIIRPMNFIGKHYNNFIMNQFGGFTSRSN